MGQSAYPAARELMIMADGGGSNGSRVRLWKLELQQLADELGLTIRVSHFPPGTSHEVIVNLIAATTTQKGLRVRAAIDDAPYQKRNQSHRCRVHHHTNYPRRLPRRLELCDLATFQIK